MAEHPDTDLLVAAQSDPEAFGVFYRRNLSAVVAYFMARTRDPELSADLTAETFAAALVALPRYRADRSPATAWLYLIARTTLIDSVRRGQVESRGRRKLGFTATALTDSDIERVQEIWAAQQDVPLALLDGLSEDVRAALSARVIDERPYNEIARTLRCSEQVVRKRVSRGLAELRSRLEEPA